MGSFGMVWLRTESTKDKRDVRRAVSRKNVIRSAALTMDSAGQSALAS
jgi:hypothetical protein